MALYLFKVKKKVLFHGGRNEKSLFRHFLHLLMRKVRSKRVNWMIFMTKQYQRMFTFAMVGGCGFLVDATSLFVLSHCLPLPLARGAAFWIAATSNWWLNRQLTFRENKNTTPISQQWGQFLAASCVGFIPNVAVTQY